MKTIVPVASILAALSTPVMAQEVKVGPARYAVTVARADVSATTPTLALRALQRIGRAAMAVCGGSGGSLREVTRAVEASACWREAVDGAVRRVDAPLLSQAWQAHHASENRS
ncbi:UrcA family protein [Sphingomonas sp. Leaf242]|uniref:UrcA family protein n=1 Tax=Sphingomonas sp. Leaf242 TaxID=1736304 RepID=UPI000714019C|nr:UrcA family protein [Sphingomonas sp. Leaf242]KQO05137.1 hypothetical protein ASF09_17190 [Sphingomonas sp. Leaf242]